MNVRFRSRWLLPLAGLGFLALVGCGDDKEVDPPAELVDIKPTRDVNQLWSAGLSGDSERLRLALRPAIVEGVVYAASHDGEIAAFAAQTGKRAWSAKTKLPLSAGPEVGAGIVVVGSSEGDLIALDAASGTEKWRISIKSEILARPLIVNDIVIVRTVDGHIEAVAVTDGAKRWSVDEQVPRLTLRGTSSPVLAGEKIIAGFDNGKVLAIDVRNGDVLWDTIVNAPSGRTELERLADIDSPPRVSGDDIFVVGFQGRVAMLALDSGQIWWARDASSYRGFAMDDTMLYLTNSDSVVIAMRKSDGAVQWEQSSLRRRGLTAPAIDGDTLVVGDFEGYLHWLDKSTGEVVARRKTDGERISNSVITDDGRAFIQTDSGKLLAFKSQAKPARNAKAESKRKQAPAAEQPAAAAEQAPQAAEQPAAAAEQTPPAAEPPAPDPG
jgi:outer membrane protein assembly factor BamB